jgi:hypothetical protein
MFRFSNSGRRICRNLASQFPTAKYTIKIPKTCVRLFSLLWNPTFIEFDQKSLSKHFKTKCVVSEWKRKEDKIVEDFNVLRKRIGFRGKIEFVNILHLRCLLPSLEEVDANRIRKTASEFNRFCQRRKFRKNFQNFGIFDSSEFGKDYFS